MPIQPVRSCRIEFLIADRPTLRYAETLTYDSVTLTIDCDLEHSVPVPKI